MSYDHSYGLSVFQIPYKQLLGECGALWGEREQVVWSICVARAVKYPFQREILNPMQDCKQSTAEKQNGQN